MELLAGYKDGTLHVIDCKPLPQNLEALKKSLPKSMAKHKKKGFVVLVDEVIPVFAKYGRSCRLGQAGADGRPVLITALEAYRNMSRLQAISFPPGKSGFFDISESVVEEQRDAGGRVTYHIDWAELRPEATLLLMAVYGAVADSMLDTGTIKHLFNLIGGNKKESESTQPLKP
ncbi:maturation control [Photobacterium aphoticum]|uniref:Maturation control n=1 Tax=Photobacterium aphoticum TaxID=754436 RepID=A0A090R074_9GAMM|nr:maturation control [Photobacterium aphoticum]